MRLIDADKLELRKFTAAGSMSEYGRGWNDALAAVVENALTIEAEPVRHGRWIEHEDGSQDCSECKYIFARIHPKNYCPNCGAKMDGGK